MARTPGFLLTFLLGALAGCGGPTRYLHPNVDLGAIKTVAILPFSSLTGEPGVADKVQALFTIELLAANAFDIVEPGRVAKTLRDARAGAGAELAPDDLQKLGKEMGAQGLFVGTVLEYGESHGSVSAPQVTIQLKLIETETGVTVWAASETRAGAGWDQRLFGVGGDSPLEAARDLVKRQIATLLR